MERITYIHGTNVDFDFQRVAVRAAACESAM